MEKQKVLLVDDNEALLLMLTVFLEMRGYEVFPESSVDSAIRELGSKHIDVLLVDLGIGNRQGEEILAHLNGSAHTRPKKIIAIATDPRLLEGSTIAPVMTANFTKPFDFDALLQELKTNPEEKS